MVEAKSAEKAATETFKKPFIMCGFLGVFWNNCSAATQPVKAQAEEKVPPDAQKGPFCVRTTCSTGASSAEIAAEKKVLLENFEHLHTQGSIGPSRKMHYGPEDHLGSTRMVLAENGEIKEALMYQPYGTIAPVEGIPGTGTDPLRQKFTTKEFDDEGDANGAPGIKAYHFGFRVYDPDLGIWMSTDPKDQLFNSYGYSTNPIMTIDPDGQYIIGAIVGAVVGAYVAGAVANEEADPTKWDWSNPNTLMSVFGGAFSGASMGSGIEDQFWLNRTKITTHYGRDATFHALEMQGMDLNIADAYILNDPYGAYREGHLATLVGDEEAGYWYFSKDGNKSTNKAIYYSSYEEFMHSDYSSRYLRQYKIETNQLQDAKMIMRGMDIYDLRYRTTTNNCGDLVGDILDAGGLFDGRRGGMTFPNSQYLQIQIQNPGTIILE